MKMPWMRTTNNNPSMLAGMGIIPTKAIKTFMARERRDVRKFKKLNMSKLIDMKNELPVKPPIWKPLDKAQRVCFLLGAEHRRFGFHLDTGMGKTLLSIALGRYIEALGEIKPGQVILVLVPNKINKAEWRREFIKWGQRKRFAILRGSSKQKWAKFRSTKALFIVETYGGFARMACALKEKRKGRGRRLQPDKKLVQELCSRVKGLVFDESTNIASRAALVTRIAKQLKKDNRLLIELTGTPFGRDPTMLHSQVFMLDDGYSLGETLGLFRAAFFTEKKNYWGGFEYHFKKEMEPTLNRFLAHSTIRYPVDQSTLPNYIPRKLVFSLPHDAEVYAEKAMAILKQSKGSYQVTKNAFLRLRQISSGWIGYEDDEEGKRAQLEFDHNPKLEGLVSLVDSIDPAHKVIVFHEYIFSGDIICRELTKAGISWGRISGRTKDHDDVLRNFARESGPRVLVLNNKFSMGPNLQAAKYGIWFEEPSSCILKKQGRRRFERQHTEHKKVFGYSMVVKGTYDQRILDNHEAGRDAFEGIIEGRKKPR